MVARFALVLLAAAAAVSSARAADLVETPSVECNCGSNMITIYDVEPGVVTRHWAECACRYEPDEKTLRRVAVPVQVSDPTPFMDPWRRW